MYRGTRYLTSGRYAVLYLAVLNPVGWQFREWRRGVLEPVDLTQFDSVRLQIMTSEGAVALSYDKPLLVLTSDDDKVADSSGALVACRARADVQFSSASGDMVAKVVGMLGSNAVLLSGRPWLVSVVSAGPSS